MPDYPEIKITSRQQWRTWLAENALEAKGIWVVYPKKSSSLGDLEWVDLVQEALCFGWIDSLPGKVDETWTKLLVTPRKPGSVWSALNKSYVPALIASGQMTPAGQKSIDVAKANGMWTWIDSIEAEVIPAILQTAFDENPVAYEHYVNFPPGSRKRIIYWLKQAKTEGTQAKRVAKIISLAKESKRAQG